MGEYASDRNNVPDLLILLMVILAVLGVAVYMVPQFTTSGDAPLSNLMTNLQSIRAQLELYRLHHNGAYPADIVAGLTRKTTESGVVSRTGTFGPYFQEFPKNAFVDDPVKAAKTSGAPGEGWSYDPKTGALIANTPGHRGL